MRYVFTGEQARELDCHAIQTVGFPGTVLMEKAAMTLVAVLMERETREQNILVVCGTGNNGGDGLAAARMLHQQGYLVRVMMIGEAEKLSEDASLQLRLAAACDVPFVSAETALESVDCDVMIDALFGVGLSRDITGVYEKIIQGMNQSGKKIYGADVPSGINSDTGQVMNVAVKADVTVTFGVNKLGLVLYPGCEYAGQVIIGDIGYPAQSYEAIQKPAIYYETEDLNWILPQRKMDGHKGDFGHVAVIGGSESMSGAICFSAQAAYASGTGMVKVCSVEQNRIPVLTGVPEALFSCFEKKEGNVSTVDKDVLEDAIRFADVVVLGPGLGTSETSRQVVSYVLAHCDKPVVLDGDGLNLCQMEQLTGRKNVILTPHPKEFSRISGREIKELKQNLMAEVQRFAQETGCVVVGKDARTIVGKDSYIYVNVSGNSGLGTAGSGDVLTGVIAAFVAQGASCYEAAKAGVYLHGLAADAYVSRYNPYSLTASELIRSLKYVLNAK